MTPRTARPRGDHQANEPGSAQSLRVTINDVAQQAGVSVSAVSKVLRDAYGISSEMRGKVNAAIDQLGYRPNAGARAMRGRSFTIGVTLVDLGSPFQPEIAQGIAEELGPTPYQEIMIAAGSSPAGNQRSIEALIDRQVDGLIVIAPWTSADWLEELGTRIPTVVIARHGGAAAYDSVVDDDAMGAGLMVDHLVALGHRRIVHTGHPSGGLRRPSVLSHTARADGYKAAMKRHGLDPEVIVTSYSEQGGYDAAIRALDRPQPPTAIFAGADIAALGVLRATEDLGLRVPEQVTVTGYDNIFFSTVGRISLTTVDQAGHLTGSMSARLVLERINGRTAPVHSIIAPSLVARSTSGPAPVSDHSDGTVTAGTPGTSMR